MFACGSGSGSLPTPALSRKRSSSSASHLPPPAPAMYIPSDQMGPPSGYSESEDRVSPTFQDAPIFPLSTPSFAPQPTFDGVPLSTNPPGDHQNQSQGFEFLPGSGSGSNSSSIHPPFHLPTPNYLYAPSPLPPPPPPFPSQFKDLGPSSRSSASLARLFALETVDSDRGNNLRGGGRQGQQLDMYRQDPVVLGFLSEQRSRELWAFFHERVNPRVCMFDDELHTHGQSRVP